MQPNGKRRRKMPRLKCIEMEGRTFAYLMGVLYLIVGVPLVGIVSVMLWAIYTDPGIH